MRYYVIDHFISGFQRAPVHTRAFPESPTVSSVMWIPFPRSLDHHQLDFFVSTVRPFILLSDVTIIGLHPDAYQAVQESPHILEDVGNRIENAPLYIVCHDEFLPAIKHVSGATIEGLESASSLNRIREQDIAAVVRKSGSELPKHPSLHYEGPNGDHYEAFLRPGFATRSIEEPTVSILGCSIASRQGICVVDHWSMISIAYHIGSYLKALGDAGGAIVQSVRDYNEDIDVLVDRLRNTYGPITPDRVSTGCILLTVQSSGRLARRLLFPAMQRVGFADPLAIALARSPSHSGAPLDSKIEVHSLTTLDEAFARQPAVECKVCRGDGGTLIPIQHDSYLLSLAAHTQLISIQRKTAQMATEVVNRYRGVRAFHVHRTHRDGRHHAYYIDLAPMLECSVFKDRLVEVTSRWQSTPIDVVLHPRHEVAERFAKMAATALGVTKIVSGDQREIANDGQFRRFTGQDRDALLYSRRVCVVDDVVITGTRVRGYRNALNFIRRRYDADECELYCLVGVARTHNERSLVGVSDMVLHSEERPRFLSVERLFLPNWDESECRWCAELRMLNKVPQHVQHRSLISSRLEALRRRDGFTDGLFLPWSTNDPNVLERYWRLGKDSVFGNVQGADLAVSVAASVQRLRGKLRQSDGTWAESQLDELFRSPLAKVLDPQFFMTGRYYEPVLVASILRAAKRHDIRTPSNDLELRGHIKTLVAEESSYGLHGELLLAVALNQLPWNRSLSGALKQAHPDMATLAQSILANHAGNSHE